MLSYFNSALEFFNYSNTETPENKKTNCTATRSHFIEATDINSRDSHSEESQILTPPTYTMTEQNKGSVLSKEILEGYKVLRDVYDGWNLNDIPRSLQAWVLYSAIKRHSSSADIDFETIITRIKNEEPILLPWLVFKTPKKRESPPERFDLLLPIIDIYRRMETREIPFSGVGIRLGEDDLRKLTYENRRKFQCKVDQDSKLAVIGPCVNFAAPISEEYVGKNDYDKEGDVFVLKHKSMRACGCSMVNDNDLEAEGVDITQFYKTLGFNKNQKDKSAVFNFPDDVVVATSALLAKTNSIGSAMMLESSLSDDKKSSKGTKSSEDGESDEDKIFGDSSSDSSRESEDSSDDDAVESEDSSNDDAVESEDSSSDDIESGSDDNLVKEEEHEYSAEVDDNVGINQEINDPGGNHVPTKQGRGKLVFRNDASPACLQATAEFYRKLQLLKSRYRPGVKHKFISILAVAEINREPKKARR